MARVYIPLTFKGFSDSNQLSLVIWKAVMSSNTSRYMAVDIGISCSRIRGQLSGLIPWTMALLTLLTASELQECIARQLHSPSHIPWTPLTISETLSADNLHIRRYGGARTVLVALEYSKFPSR